MSALGLRDSVPDGVTRAVVDAVTGLVDLPVASVLSWRHPSSPLPRHVGRAPSVEWVTRVVVGRRGGPLRSFAFAEHPAATGIGVLVTASGTWSDSVESLADATGRVLGRAARSVTEGPTADSATNEEVAELTELAHSSSLHTLRALEAHLPVREALIGFPVLSEAPEAVLVGDGGAVRDGLAILREVDSGAPVEWVLRRRPRRFAT